MTLPQGKTLLRQFEKAKQHYPDLTFSKHASMVGLPTDIYISRVRGELDYQKLQAKIQDIRHNGAVTVVTLNLEIGQSQWLLLLSDNHHDSIYCNRELETEHLDEAVNRDARIYDFGDLNDAMQGRYDPRRAMAELRPEYVCDKYLDKIVKDTSDYFRHYAPYFDLMAPGNHELTILKNAQTDIMGRITENLGIHYGGFGGWVLYKIGSFTVKLKYYHGSGGEAPVTRGAIQTNRQAVYLPDADIVVNGHSHNAYYIPISRERLSDDGGHYFDIQHHLRIPGYKQAYGDGSAGWEVTRGGVPKPIGCWWVKLTRLENRIDILPIADIRGAVPISVAEDQTLFTGQVYTQDPEGN